MDFMKVLQPGIIALIGGGGKTTFLQTIGAQLSQHHRVLLCTTTKIYPFPGIPFARSLGDLDKLRQENSLLYTGQVIPQSGKLGAPDIAMVELASRFDYILVEADGSAHRPMKAHASYEPVIPKNCNQIICVVGASGFGQPIFKAAHRPELYAGIAGVSINTVITPEIEAKVLRTEHLHDMVLINQVETAKQAEQSQRLGHLLACPVIAGSLQGGDFFKCEL